MLAIRHSAASREPKFAAGEKICHEVSSLRAVSCQNRAIVWANAHVRRYVRHYGLENSMEVDFGMIAQKRTWFLAQLKPNSARIAHENLSRQGFETFLPMEEVTVRRRGQFTDTMRPVFPGYIFVAFDRERGFWRAINSTFGVVKLVSFGQEPAPVPESLITQLVHRCDAKGKLLPSSKFEPGESVRVQSGPFANLVAQIEKIEPDRRVWLLLDILGGKTRVAVSAEQIRPIGQVRKRQRLPNA